jgi:hypothetical protein
VVGGGTMILWKIERRDRGEVCVVNKDGMRYSVMHTEFTLDPVEEPPTHGPLPGPIRCDVWTDKFAMMLARDPKEHRRRNEARVLAEAILDAGWCGDRPTRADLLPAVDIYPKGSRIGLPGNPPHEVGR